MSRTSCLVTYSHNAHKHVDAMGTATIQTVKVMVSVPWRVPSGPHGGNEEEVPLSTSKILHAGRHWLLPRTTNTTCVPPCRHPTHAHPPPYTGHLQVFEAGQGHSDAAGFSASAALPVHAPRDPPAPPCRTQMWPQQADVAATT